MPVGEDQTRVLQSQEASHHVAAPEEELDDDLRGEAGGGHDDPVRAGDKQAHDADHRGETGGGHDGLVPAGDQQAREADPHGKEGDCDAQVMSQMGFGVQLASPSFDNYLMSSFKNLLMSSIDNNLLMSSFQATKMCPGPDVCSFSLFKSQATVLMIPHFQVCEVSKYKF